jgi:DNA-binding NarL/FixJ family response regulator
MGVDGRQPNGADLTRQLSLLCRRSGLELSGNELVRMIVSYVPPTVLRGDLKSLAPSLAVVILATGSETGLLHRAFEAGAAGWISKDAGAEGFGRAMQQICEFGDAKIVFEPQHEDEVFERVDLTKRELEVLRLIADGSTNADVAQRLWVSERTIKFHLSNIYEKLGVQNHTAACRWAETHGLLPPSGGQRPETFDRAA